MKIIYKSGKEDIATVYLAKTESGKYIEFVESVQPPVPKNEKWVLIISTLFGCPVGCSICDAGGWYEGKLSKEELVGQIEYLILKSFPNGKVPVEKFKIQFARMGEPALNNNVLDVLTELPNRFYIPGFMPSISTVAPLGTDIFFEKLLEIKNKIYNNGNFQLQFSIHSTDNNERDKLIPIKKWDFKRIADYGNDFFSKDDRKITLNFALSDNYPIDYNVISEYFDPEKFLIKLTPINPTITAKKNNINNGLLNLKQINENEIIKKLKANGYAVLISIGELEENKIGSNCGQFVKRFLTENKPTVPNSYTYIKNEKIKKIS